MTDWEFWFWLGWVELGWSLYIFWLGLKIGEKEAKYKLGFSTRKTSWKNRIKEMISGVRQVTSSEHTEPPFTPQPQEMKKPDILQKYVIMLLNADEGKPIPSLDHLEAMVFLCAKNDPELQAFLDSHSSTPKASKK